MRREGQRQEIMYLGLAVAALLCGLAVILAARVVARRPRPAEPSQTATQTAKRPARKKADRPTAATGSSQARNPFATLAGPGARPPSRGNRRQEDPDEEDRRPPRGGRREPGDDRRRVEENQLDADLQLLGIMRGGAAMAVIREGEDRHYLRVGDTVAEYRLAKISTDSVTLTRGSETATLTMHQEKRDRSRDRRGRPARRVRR